MQRSIDKFGRIVIPKQMRERLGWESRTRIEIEVCDYQLWIKAIDEQPKLKFEHDILVFTGKIAD